MSDTSGREQSRPHRRGRPPAPALNPDEAETEAERRRLTRLARSRAVSAEWRARQRVMQSESASQLQALQDEVHSLRTLLAEQEHQRSLMHQSLTDAKSDMQLLREQNDLLHQLLQHTTKDDSVSRTLPTDAPGAQAPQYLAWQQGMALQGPNASFPEGFVSSEAPAAAQMIGGAAGNGEQVQTAGGPPLAPLAESNSVSHLPVIGAPVGALPGSNSAPHLAATFPRLLAKQLQQQGCMPPHSPSGIRINVGEKRRSMEGVMASHPLSASLHNNKRVEGAQQRFSDALQHQHQVLGTNSTVSPSASASMSLSSCEIAAVVHTHGGLPNHQAGSDQLLQWRSDPTPLGSAAEAALSWDPIRQMHGKSSMTLPTFEPGIAEPVRSLAGRPARSAALMRHASTDAIGLLSGTELGPQDDAFWQQPEQLVKRAQSLGNSTLQAISGAVVGLPLGTAAGNGAPAGWQQQGAVQQQRDVIVSDIEDQVCSGKQSGGNKASGRQANDRSLLTQVTQAIKHERQAPVPPHVATQMGLLALTGDEMDAVDGAVSQALVTAKDAGLIAAGKVQLPGQPHAMLPPCNQFPGLWMAEADRGARPTAVHISDVPCLDLPEWLQVDDLQLDCTLPPQDRQT